MTRKRYLRFEQFWIAAAFILIGLVGHSCSPSRSLGSTVKKGDIIAIEELEIGLDPIEGWKREKEEGEGYRFNVVDTVQRITWGIFLRSHKLEEPVVNAEGLFSREYEVSIVGSHYEIIKKEKVKLLEKEAFSVLESDMAYMRKTYYLVVKKHAYYLIYQAYDHNDYKTKEEYDFMSFEKHSETFEKLLTTHNWRK